MGESFSKKEKEKKRKEKKMAKEEKMEARKSMSDKGKSLKDMMAYVDEFGNLTSNPTDYKNKQETRLEDIQISVPTMELREQVVSQKGIVGYFNEEKGYGFIKDSNSAKDVFFHINALLHKVQTGDRVAYQLVRGKKGPEASDITKL